jgi:hypothetical protein
MPEPIDLGLFLDVIDVHLPDNYKFYFGWGWSDSSRAIQGELYWVYHWDHVEWVPGFIGGRADIIIDGEPWNILSGLAVDDPTFGHLSVSPPIITSYAGLSASMTFGTDHRPPTYASSAEDVGHFSTVGVTKAYTDAEIARWQSLWTTMTGHNVSDTTLAVDFASFDSSNPQIHFYFQEFYFAKPPKGGVINATAPSIAPMLKKTDIVDTSTLITGFINGDTGSPKSYTLESESYRGIERIGAAFWEVSIFPSTMTQQEILAVGYDGGSPSHGELYQAEPWDVVLDTDEESKQQVPVNSQLQYGKVQFPDGSKGPAVWPKNGDGNYQWRKLKNPRNPRSGYTDWVKAPFGTPPGRPI